MKVKQFLSDGMKEAGRQLFGLPRRKRRVYRYVLTLSVPMKTTELVKELRDTNIFKHFLSLEDVSKNQQGVGFKYIIARRRGA